MHTGGPRFSPKSSKPRDPLRPRQADQAETLLTRTATLRTRGKRQTSSHSKNTPDSTQASSTQQGLKPQNGMNEGAHRCPNQLNRVSGPRTGRQAKHNATSSTQQGLNPTDSAGGEGANGLAGWGRRAGAKARQSTQVTNIFDASNAPAPSYGMCR